MCKRLVYKLTCSLALSLWTNANIVLGTLTRKAKFTVVHL